jgi:hypothetical protein
VKGAVTVSLGKVGFVKINIIEEHHDDDHQTTALAEFAEKGADADLLRE